MLGKIRNKLKNKKGFTMVELIVVIVIILVLAGALVPQVLKYVEKSREANCKADAATILAQVQADYAAMQASDETGVSAITQIGEVMIAPATAEVTADTVNNKNDAAYYVKEDNTNHVYEITSFGYNNGSYTAIWSSGKWTVTKNNDGDNAGSGTTTPPSTTEENGETGA